MAFPMNSEIKNYCSKYYLATDHELNRKNEAGTHLQQLFAIYWIYSFKSYFTSSSGITDLPGLWHCLHHSDPSVLAWKEEAGF